LPALLIGFIVGLKPLFWYQKLFGSRESGSRPNPEEAKKLTVKKFLPLILAILFASSIAEASGEVFRPIVLAYHTASHSLYTVTSSSLWGSDTVYRLDVLDEYNHLEPLGKTEAAGVASDHFFIERGDGLWLATVACREILTEQSQFRTTMRTLLLMPLLKNKNEKRQPTMKKSLRGIGYYFGITYDPQKQRFLISDPVRKGIYEIKLTEKGFSEEQLVFSHDRFQKPACLLWSQAGLFIADAGTGEIYHIDLSNKELRLVAKNVLSPTSLTLSPNGKMLYITDGGKAVVLEANLETGLQREYIKHSALQTPNAVAIDSNGNFWVADSGARAIFMFSRTSQLMKTIRP